MTSSSLQFGIVACWGRSSWAAFIVFLVCGAEMLKTVHQFFSERFLA